MTGIRDKVNEIVTQRPYTSGDKAFADALAEGAKLAYATILNGNADLDEHHWREFVSGITEVLQGVAADVSVTETALVQEKPVWGLQVLFVIPDGDVDDIVHTLKIITDLQDIQAQWHVATTPLDSYVS